MLELEASRTGPPTAVIRGLYLHSGYDPGIEAERFVREALRDEHPSRILLLGAGLGYLLRALCRKVPAARIVPVYYDESVHARATALLAEQGEPPACVAEALRAAWHPRSIPTLLEHLRNETPELECEGLAVVEWPSSARLFPQVSREANQAVHQLLKELRGSLVTTAALGRRWLRNAFRNFVFLEDFALEPRGPEATVCIAASGPSLEYALPLIAPYRERFSLWALPSSLLALRELGLRPDRVVLTDPGYYAVAHLYPGAGMHLEVAMPLSAACGTWRIGARVLPLSQGTFFETALFGLAGLKPLALPSFGTVAASALELARRLGASQVLFAGLDLCHRGIRSHTRPNVFDRFVEDRAGRLSPMFHRAFGRRVGQRGQRDGPNLALDTYAGWFASLRPEFGPRLYRLLPSEVALPAFQDLDERGFREFAGKLPRSAVPAASVPSRRPRSTPPARRARALALLEEWAAGLRRVAGGFQREPPSGVRHERTLLEDPLLLWLCYYCDAAALAEVRRLARLESPVKAAERLGALARTSADFLESLGAALGGP